jgi:hypothetical protein
MKSVSALVLVMLQWCVHQTERVGDEGGTAGIAEGRGVACNGSRLPMRNGVFSKLTLAEPDRDECFGTPLGTGTNSAFETIIERGSVASEDQ